MDDFKNKVAEMLEKNMLNYVSAAFGLVVPGGLTILVFKMSLFYELDILKILLLSFTISAPVFGTVFLINALAKGKTNIHQEGDRFFAVSAVFNLVIFSVAILLKILISSINIKVFVIIIFLLCMLFYCMNIKDIISNQSKKLSEETKETYKELIEEFERRDN